MTAEEYIKHYASGQGGFESVSVDIALMAIEYAKREAKQQMIAKAIDGVIAIDYYGDDDKTYGCIAHDSFCLEDMDLKDMDKVKIILIKED